ncbi:ISL3 family transposase [Ruminococcaceae bacterium OttesenSCG-928-N02]|nr:ISL3 family transposase [Ruminococcaceae bacterium OttesenSCG-928-N02]
MERPMPDLGLEEFKVIDFEENDFFLDIVVIPTKKRQYISCPECGSSYVEVKEETERHFRDLNIRDKRVGVYALADRYVCNDCKKGFALEYDCIPPKARMTTRLKESIQKRALCYSFADVAREFGMPPSTVEEKFSEYAEMLDRRPAVLAPKILGIDECHLQKTMRAVYVDIENSKILEMGPSKKMDSVIRDLSAFVDLSRVEIVATDMDRGYISAIREVLPHAIHVIDKFHVIQAFLKTVDAARSIIYETIKKRIQGIEHQVERNTKYRELMALEIDAWTFRMNPQNMKCLRYEYYIKTIESHPEFAELAELRRGFMEEFYGCNSIEDARASYDKWCSLVPKDALAYAEMRKFIRVTMKNHDKEIFNFFLIDGKRRTNAVTERLNGAIKAMQLMGRGYSFKILRAKMLYGAETSIKPLYERIVPKRKRKDILRSYDERKSLSKMELLAESKYERDYESLELPLDECGTIQHPEYYEGTWTKEKEQAWLADPRNSNLPYGRETIGSDTVIVKNGGADIDAIIRYYEKNGECI